MSIVYRFDNENYQLKSLSFNGTGYEISFLVPKYAQVLQYSLNVTDTSGNYMKLSFTRNVLDIIKPEIIDTSGDPTTGDAFLMVITTKDNIGVVGTNISYRFDDGAVTTVKYYAGMWIQIPSGCRVLHYSIKAIDQAGNSNETFQDRTVKDNDPPAITDLTNTTAKAEKWLTFTALAIDNIQVKQMSVEYWYNDGAKHETLTMNLDNGLYTVKIKVKDKATLNYSIKCVDNTGNSAATGPVSLKISKAEGMLSSGILLIAILILIVVVIIIAVLIATKLKRKKVKPIKRRVKAKPRKKIVKKK